MTLYRIVWSGYQRKRSDSRVMCSVSSYAFKGVLAIPDIGSTGRFLVWTISSLILGTKRSRIAFLSNTFKRLVYRPKSHGINGKWSPNMKIWSARTKKAWTSWSSFFNFQRPKLKTKNYCSGEGRALSESTKNFFIRSVVFEIFALKKSHFLV